MNAEGKPKVAKVALMEAVQLEMKSKLKHGKSHPVWQVQGIWSGSVQTILLQKCRINIVKLQM